jgi:uncharacterized protein (TIGR03435 family)
VERSVLVGLFLTCVLVAQTKFEVASIKLNTNCRPEGGQPLSPGRLNLHCVPLRQLIQAAYINFANGPNPSAKRLQILGGPGWIDSDQYDITAKAVDAAPLDQMAGPMLQVLLEDRFRLKVHRETREVPIYVLTVGKNGVKPGALNPAANCVPIDLNHLAPPAPGQPMPNICDHQMFKSDGPNRVVESYGRSMEGLAGGLLSNNLDRPVIDKTGITGRFDFTLEFARNMADDTGTSIFTAVQEQLGLKLVPDKGPVQVLVIDHVEKPSEN